MLDDRAGGGGCLLDEDAVGVDLAVGAGATVELVAGDEIVCDEDVAGADVDAAGGVLLDLVVLYGRVAADDDASTKRLAVGAGGAVLDDEAGEYGLCSRGGDEHGDCRAEGASVDGRYRGCRRRCAGWNGGDGDRLACEVDVFVVGAGGDEDGVAWVGDVDGGLDCVLVGGDVDDGEGAGWSQAKPKDKKEQGAEKSRRVHDHRRSFCLLGPESISC